MSTRSCLFAGIVGGVMMRTGTPAILSSVTFVGYIPCMSMASCFCHASARALFCSSVTGGSVSGIGSESHFCDSGLTVFGTGTTRVTCAVPLASMKLELVCGTEAVFLCV